MDRPGLINAILQKKPGPRVARDISSYPDDRLLYYYRWLKKRDATKEVMCEAIRQAMTNAPLALLPPCGRSIAWSISHLSNFYRIFYHSNSHQGDQNTW